MKVHGLALGASLFLLGGCSLLPSKIKATTYHPDGSVTQTECTKGLLDDLDLPTTGSTIRVGPSKVAGETVVRLYGMTGEQLRKYAVERAAQKQ